MIEIGTPGTLPSEIGGDMQAANLAEPFLAQGTLPSGTYVVVANVANKNIFYATV